MTLRATSRATRRLRISAPPTIGGGLLPGLRTAAVVAGGWPGVNVVHVAEAPSRPGLQTRPRVGRWLRSRHRRRRCDGRWWRRLRMFADERLLRSRLRARLRHRPVRRRTGIGRSRGRRRSRSRLRSGLRGRSRRRNRPCGRQRPRLRWIRRWWNPFRRRGGSRGLSRRRRNRPKARSGVRRAECDEHGCALDGMTDRLQLRCSAQRALDDAGNRGRNRNRAKTRFWLCTRIAEVDRDSVGPQDVDPQMQGDRNGDRDRRNEDGETYGAQHADHESQVGRHDGAPPRDRRGAVAAALTTRFLPSAFAR